jgi:hypothetical protein
MAFSDTWEIPAFPAKIEHIFGVQKQVVGAIFLGKF